MSELWRRVRMLVGCKRFDRDLEEEMRAHVEMQAEENRENGMDAIEARYAARRRFGNSVLLNERSREMWGWTWLERLGQDLRYACRTMRRSPGLTLAAVVSLALGIGADTAIFSVMDGLWFRPLAVRDPGSLVRVFTASERQTRGDTSYLDYLDYRQADTLAGLAASERRGPMLGVDGVTESAWSDIVSDNYFSVVGVQAALGRVFVEQPRPEDVLVISYSYWQRRFGGDPAVVGRVVQLKGRSFMVIGVAPKEFRGTELWTDMDAWIPMSAWGETQDRDSRGFTVVGRLRAGATLAQVRAELSGIASNLARAYPKTNKDCDAIVMSAFEYQFVRAGDTGLMLAVTLAMLLLIACANVANLLLARGEARRSEIAVRLAIGCGRARLVRQLMTESLLLAFLGAGAGLLLATWLIRVFPTLLPNVHLLFRLDHRVLLFTLGATVVSGLLFGLVPALRASRPDLVPALRAFAPRDGLVVAQMALSLVLLTGAGLLLRSFLYCLHLDLGFARKSALIVRLDPGLPETQARVFYDQLLERARALPGVKQAGLARRVPLWPSEDGLAREVSVPGYQFADGETTFACKFTTVGDNYFRTMGIPLVRGREFDGRDNAAGLPVAIINETMARRFWPEEDPVGTIIQVGRTSRQVVGVVKDVKVNWVLEAPMPYFYLPFGQDFSYTMSLVVETSGDPLALANPIKSEVRALARIPTPEMDTLDSLVDRSTLEKKGMAWLVGMLGVVGVLLTAAGLYGVMSYLVARRTREIGIRMALGACEWHALTLILRRALGLAAVGVAIGIAGALAASRLLSSLVVGVSPRDPATLASTCALLVAVAVAACLPPARRAARIEPMEALRYE